jgi:hypothetical protein
MDINSSVYHSTLAMVFPPFVLSPQMCGFEKLARFFRILAKLVEFTLKTRKFPNLFVTTIPASQHQHMSVEKLIHFDIFILKICIFWKIHFP